MQQSFDLATHTILDNDFKISRNCIIFIKHTNNSDIRYRFYNNIVQSLESPSVKDLVGSHVGDYISNPIDKLKKTIMLAKDTGILRLKKTFYRHSSKEKLTKEFILTHMNYLKDLLLIELIYHNPINNQFNLVCISIVHNICIYNSKFNTALISLFQNSLTGKSNGFFLKNVNTTNLSNALKYYTSNKPIIVLLTKIDFENNEISIQQDSYLRIGQEQKLIFQMETVTNVLYSKIILLKSLVYILTILLNLYYQRSRYLFLLLKIILNLKNLILISKLLIIQKYL